MAWVHGLVKPLSVSLGLPSALHNTPLPSCLVPPRRRAHLLSFARRRCGSKRPFPAYSRPRCLGALSLPPSLSSLALQHEAGTPVSCPLHA